MLQSFHSSTKAFLLFLFGVVVWNVSKEFYAAQCTEASHWTQQKHAVHAAASQAKEAASTPVYAQSNAPSVPRHDSSKWILADRKLGEPGHVIADRRLRIAYERYIVLLDCSMGHRHDEHYIFGKVAEVLGDDVGFVVMPFPDYKQNKFKAQYLSRRRQCGEAGGKSPMCLVPEALSILFKTPYGIEGMLKTWGIYEPAFNITKPFQVILSSNCHGPLQDERDAMHPSVDHAQMAPHARVPPTLADRWNEHGLYLSSMQPLFPLGKLSEQDYRRLIAEDVYGFDDIELISNAPARPLIGDYGPETFNSMFAANNTFRDYRFWRGTKWPAFGFASIQTIQMAKLDAQFNPRRLVRLLEAGANPLNRRPKAEQEAEMRRRNKFCVMLHKEMYKAGRYNGDGITRYVLWQMINERKTCDSPFSNGFQCTSGVYETDLCYRDYKFVFATQNGQITSHIDEKIESAVLGGAIPIYFGADNIGEHMNSKRIIHCKLQEENVEKLRAMTRSRGKVWHFDPDDPHPSDEKIAAFARAIVEKDLQPCVDEVFRVDADDEEYIARVSEPLIPNNDVLDSLYDMNRVAHGVADLLRALASPVTHRINRRVEEDKLY